ncbi:MAG: hypothetical protein ACXV7J_14525 [Methylomonas sp.]
MIKDIDALINVACADRILKLEVLSDNNIFWHLNCLVYESAADAISPMDNGFQPIWRLAHAGTEWDELRIYLKH